MPPTPVARLGLFARRIDLLAAAGDSTRSHYTAFRTHYNRRAALTLVAIATFTASIILVSASYNASDPQQYEGAAIGLFVGSVVLGFGAGVSRAKAEDHLQQAIWFYNRALPRGP